MTLTRRANCILIFAGVLALAGCATRVETTGPALPPPSPAAALPRPARVVVQPFLVDWHMIQLDQGLRARLESATGNSAEQQQRLAAEVQQAIQQTLIDQINGMGLLAVPGPPDMSPGPDSVVIRGQITRVDAGNSTRRTLIGFGAGKSEVFASTEVLALTRGRSPVLLQSYDAQANSGRAPGLGVGAASAAAGSAAMAASSAVVGTTMRAREGLPRDAQHLANRVATNLGRLFAGQNWIPESAIPGPSL